MTAKRQKFKSFGMQIRFIFFEPSKLLAANKPDSMLLPDYISEVKKT